MSVLPLPEFTALSRTLSGIKFKIRVSHGNPTIAIANVSSGEYTSMTIDHGETQINDWFFVDGKGFAVGPNGLLLKHERN